MAVKIVSWNMNESIVPWHELVGMDADVALLQEACEPPCNIKRRIDVGYQSWETRGHDARRPWRTAVVRLSDRVELERIDTRSLEYADPEDLAVSRPGTLSVAIVKAPGVECFTVASMYSLRAKPHTSTASSWIVSDDSAHRLVSDLSALVGCRDGHRIVAAGDLNILHGYGRYGDEYWAERYDTVFARMDALWAAVRRAAGSARAPGRPVARRAARRESERPDVPHVPARPGDRRTPTRLRLRVAGHGRFGPRACAQRARRVGPQRPLPPGDHGLLRAPSGLLATGGSVPGGPREF